MILDLEEGVEPVLKRYHCVFYKLNLVLKATEKHEHIKIICTHIREFIKHFAHSTNHKEELIQICKDLYSNKVFTDKRRQSGVLLKTVPTRWNSFYPVVERLCDIQEGIGPV